MTYCRRTASDKILHDKPFNVAKNPKYDWCQGGITSMVVVLKMKIFETNN